MVRPKAQLIVLRPFGLLPDSVVLFAPLDGVWRTLTEGEAGERVLRVAGLLLASAFTGDARVVDVGVFVCNDRRLRPCETVINCEQREVVNLHRRTDRAWGKYFLLLFRPFF